MKASKALLFLLKSSDTIKLQKLCCFFQNFEKHKSFKSFDKAFKIEALIFSYNFKTPKILRMKYIIHNHCLRSRTIQPAIYWKGFQIVLFYLLLPTIHWPKCWCLFNSLEKPFCTLSIKSIVKQNQWTFKHSLSRLWRHRQTDPLTEHFYLCTFSITEQLRLKLFYYFLPRFSSWKGCRWHFFSQNVFSSLQISIANEQILDSII